MEEGPADGLRLTAEENQRQSEEQRIPIDRGKVFRRPLALPFVLPLMQPFKQPLKLPFMLLSKQPIKQLFKQSFTQPFKQTFKQLFKQPFKQPFEQLSKQPFKQPSKQPFKQLSKQLLKEYPIAYPPLACEELLVLGSQGVRAKEGEKP